MARAIALEILKTDLMCRSSHRRRSKPASAKADREAEVSGRVAVSLAGLQFLSQHAVPMSQNGVVTPNHPDMVWLVYPKAESEDSDLGKGQSS